MLRRIVRLEGKLLGQAPELRGRIQLGHSRRRLIWWVLKLSAAATSFPPRVWTMEAVAPVLNHALAKRAGSTGLDRPHRRIWRDLSSDRVRVAFAAERTGSTRSRVCADADDQEARNQNYLHSTSYCVEAAYYH